jgi:hypothetical protein
MVRPKNGIVVCYKDCLFCDEMWPVRLESEEYKTTHGKRMLQRIKTEDNRVYTELKKIQNMAEKHKVPRENILFVDCTDSNYTCEEISHLAIEGLNRNMKFNTIRSNSLWPGFKNSVGLEFTDCFIDEIWEETRSIENM